LFEVVIESEEDGSLSLEKLGKEVLKNDVVLFLWDDLIGSELTEEQSMSLLLVIIQIIVKIVRRGISKRSVIT